MRIYAIKSFLQHVCLKLYTNAYYKNINAFGQKNKLLENITANLLFFFAKRNLRNDIDLIVIKRQSNDCRRLI